MNILTKTTNVLTTKTTVQCQKEFTIEEWDLLAWFFDELTPTQRMEAILIAWQGLRQEWGRQSQGDF